MAHYEHQQSLPGIVCRIKPLAQRICQQLFPLRRIPAQIHILIYRLDPFQPARYIVIGLILMLLLRGMKSQLIGFAQIFKTLGVILGVMLRQQCLILFFDGSLVFRGLHLQRFPGLVDGHDSLSLLSGDHTYSLPSLCLRTKFVCSAGHIVFVQLFCS